MKLLLVFIVLLITFAAQGAAIYEASEGPLEGIHFVSIPAGDLLIGSDISCSDCFNEVPQRIIQIDSFEIMSKEVTQGMWKELMGSDDSSIPFLWTGLCGRGSDYPVYAIGILISNRSDSFPETAYLSQ